MSVHYNSVQSGLRVTTADISGCGSCCSGVFHDLGNIHMYWADILCFQSWLMQHNFARNTAIACFESNTRGVFYKYPGCRCRAATVVSFGNFFFFIIKSRNNWKEQLGKGPPNQTVILPTLCWLPQTVLQCLLMPSSLLTLRAVSFCKDSFVYSAYCRVRPLAGVA